MRLMDQVLPDGWYEGQRAAFRKAIEEKAVFFTESMILICVLLPTVRVSVSFLFCK